MVHPAASEVLSYIKHLHSYDQTSAEPKEPEEKSQPSLTNIAISCLPGSAPIYPELFISKLKMGKDVSPVHPGLESALDDTHYDLIEREIPLPVGAASASTKDQVSISPCPLKKRCLLFSRSSVMNEQTIALRIIEKGSKHRSEATLQMLGLRIAISNKIYPQEEWQQVINNKEVVCDEISEGAASADFTTAQDLEDQKNLVQVRSNEFLNLDWTHTLTSIGAVRQLRNAATTHIVYNLKPWPSITQEKVIEKLNERWEFPGESMKETIKIIKAKHPNRKRVSEYIASKLSVLYRDSNQLNNSIISWFLQGLSQTYNFCYTTSFLCPQSEENYIEYLRHFKEFHESRNSNPEETIIIPFVFQKLLQTPFGKISYTPHITYVVIKNPQLKPLIEFFDPQGVVAMESRTFLTAIATVFAKRSSDLEQPVTFPDILTNRIEYQKDGNSCGWLFCQQIGEVVSSKQTPLTEDEGLGILVDGLLMQVSLVSLVNDFEVWLRMQ